MLAAMSDLDPQPATSDEMVGADTAAPPPAPTAVAAPAVTVELTAIEARVLGCMVEKSFLTPDVYPMTTNALVGACNQKTNRDPVVEYSAVQIDSTLLDLRQRNLVRRVHTPASRATKHRQTIDEALALDEQEVVLLSVLMLRGPQTVGELRLRTERHEVGFDDLEAVEATLERLASRPTPIVRQLPRQPGHKESRWKHLLLDESDDGMAVADDSAGALGGTAAAPTAHVGDSVAPASDRRDLAERPSHGVDPAGPTGRAEPAGAHGDGAELHARIEALEAHVERLQRQLRRLADSLGEPLDVD